MAWQPRPAGQVSLSLLLAVASGVSRRQGLHNPRPCWASTRLVSVRPLPLAHVPLVCTAHGGDAVALGLASCPPGAGRGRWAAPPAQRTCFPFDRKSMTAWSRPRTEATMPSCTLGNAA